VELDPALGGLRLEVGCDVAERQTHVNCSSCRTGS
jgi:hypothetical protein